MTRVVTGSITVVAHEIPVKDVIGTSNGWRSLVPISLLMENHVYVVKHKTRDIF